MGRESTSSSSSEEKRKTRSSTNSGKKPSSSSSPKNTRQGSKNKKTETKAKNSKMKKLKELFNKNSDSKPFKNAGTGHRLNESGPSSSASTCAASTSSITSQSAVRRTGPDQNVARAALARIEGKATIGTKTIPPKQTLNDLMIQERQKFNEELKLKQELEERKQKNAAIQEELDKNPYSEFENSQLFTCPAIGVENSISFPEIIRRMKTFIYDTYTDDAIERAAMYLLNCNRSIKLDDTSIKPKLEIIKILVRNLKMVSVQDESEENDEEVEDEMDKYKRVRKAKLEEKRVLSLEGSLDLLYAIGFTNEDEFFVYVGEENETNESKNSKMDSVLNFLENYSQHVFPILLDRQMQLSDDLGAETGMESEADLQLTSSDVKQFYSNLERNREISELMASRETKEKLLQNKSNHIPIFARLKFRFVMAGQMQVVSATFYSTEKLSCVREWFIDTFGGPLGTTQIQFKLGLEQLNQFDQSLLDLKLTPAATILVISQ